MQRNKLGNSGIEVTQLGFGAMSLSGEDRLADINLIKEAYSEGIHYFDTADLYGKGENERLLGEALTGIRQDIILATKVGNVWHEDGPGRDWNVSKEYLNKAVDASLVRLKTDYIDLYQLHGGTNTDNCEEIIETFERLKETGKIRAYGLSSIRPNVFKYYSEHSAIVSNMMQYSVLDTRPEEYFTSFQSNDVSIIARGALAQGVLIGKSAKPYLATDVDTVTHLQEQITLIAKSQGVSNLAIALAYVLQNSIIASALVGIRNKAQLIELLHAYEEIRTLNANQFIPLGIDSHYKEHRD
ncbi:MULTISPECIES: aldo/keto reductase [Sphingobacterium]|uniref:aldo/keto reductase n=1 Tax=Sphingobacterium TaxID=28453 RepID=UPI0013D998F4|nr:MULTISPECIES: aldo/keto reductase [unclassified Sphingobacterium]